MRRLKIATKNTDQLHLEGVPEEYKFVENIAKKFAETNEELKVLYTLGVEQAIKLKMEATEKDYDSKVAWVVTQIIKTAKLNRKTEN